MREGDQEKKKAIIFLRVDPDIKRRIIRIAELENRSINHVGNRMLLKGLREVEEELSSRLGLPLPPSPSDKG